LCELGSYDTTNTPSPGLLAVRDALEAFAMLLVEGLTEVDPVDEVEAAIARTTAQELGVDQVEDNLAKVAGGAYTPTLKHDRGHRAKLIGCVFFDPDEQFPTTNVAIFASQLIATEVRHRVVQSVEYKVVRVTREPTVPTTHGLDLVF
jgi:hypothetical protein